MSPPTIEQDLARLEEIAAHHAADLKMVEERRRIWKRLEPKAEQRTRLKDGSSLTKTKIAKASGCSIDNINQGLAYVKAKARG